MNDPIETNESNVRSYARLFPAVFDRARNSQLWDTRGKEYIDFFCGAGSLNYGHNPPLVKQALIEYLHRDGITLSLDMVTVAKVRFVQQFNEIILAPRGLDYRLQFTGPTGANAVEAAIKLARKQTGRSHVVAFTSAYHGHTLGALALTANRYYHNEAFGARNNVTHLPYDGYLGDFDTSVILEKMLADPSSGLPLPAAVVLETLQSEGGINVASRSWLRRIEEVCRVHDIRLIIDDIQVGNGRTGKFFSFEHADIIPDLVCLSKSIGGGLPLSLVLIRPDLDVWKPGEHTGTFRGNNLAFVAGAAVLDHWRDPEFEQSITDRGNIIHAHLSDLLTRYHGRTITLRGRGMIWGLDVGSGVLARQIIDHVFKDGLILEASGADDQVLKIMPALTIDIEMLRQGLQRLETAVDAVLGSSAAQ
jgi:diaminobutyrate-2-oxoglutarate transaminase